CVFRGSPPHSGFRIPHSALLPILPRLPPPSLSPAPSFSASAQFSQRLWFLTKLKNLEESPNIFRHIQFFQVSQEASSRNHQLRHFAAPLECRCVRGRRSLRRRVQ